MSTGSAGFSLFSGIAQLKISYIQILGIVNVECRFKFPFRIYPWTVKGSILVAIVAITVNDDGLFICSRAFRVKLSGENRTTFEQDFVTRKKCPAVDFIKRFKNDSRCLFRNPKITHVFSVLIFDKIKRLRRSCT